MRLIKKCIEHPAWGPLVITVNPRARRIIMRARPEAIHITASPYATGQDIEKALTKFGNRLKEQQQSSKRSIEPGYSIGNGKFCISVEKYQGKNFMWVHDSGRAALMCPEDTDFTARHVWLQKAAINELTSEARRILPDKLRKLSERHALKYGNCSVRNTHSRWGSCSGKGNISLSIYLVLLPEELIDYVLLHELCHTIEMNHSGRFWALLDKLCGCSAKLLRNELKKYSPVI